MPFLSLQKLMCFLSLAGLVLDRVMVRVRDNISVRVRIRVRDNISVRVRIRVRENISVRVKVRDNRDYQHS